MKLEQIFPLIYCINLDRRIDRWANSYEELSGAGIEALRFSAIEKTPGYIGCWESHLQILREARDKNENVFIFEDDANMAGKDFLEDTIEELSKIEWEMFYLGGNILRPFFQISKHLARLTHCQSTHAYGVNKKILDPLIKVIERYHQTHIDLIYTDIVVPNVQAYISVPMISMQSESYSDIEGRTMNYSLPRKRYYHYLTDVRRCNV